MCWWASIALKRTDVHPPRPYADEMQSSECEGQPNVGEDEVDHDAEKEGVKSPVSGRGTAAGLLERSELGKGRGMGERERRKVDQPVPPNRGRLLNSSPQRGQTRECSP